MFGGWGKIAMKKTEIAASAGVDKGFAQFVLEGKRNPNTKKGMEVVLAAADAYAQECRARFVAEVLRKWKLKEMLKKQSKILPKEVKQRGIYWNESRKKWCVQIKIDGKTKNFGRYSDKDEAISVYEREIFKARRII